jgi:hypothetical protein
VVEEKLLWSFSLAEIFGFCGSVFSKNQDFCGVAIDKIFFLM